MSGGGATSDEINRLRERAVAGSHQVVELMRVLRMPILPAISACCGAIASLLTYVGKKDRMAIAKHFTDTILKTAEFSMGLPDNDEGGEVAEHGDAAESA